jgi:hypothetical protein
MRRTKILISIKLNFLSRKLRMMPVMDELIINVMKYAPAVASIVVAILAL